MFREKVKVIRSWKGFSIKQDVTRLGESERLAEAEKHHTDVGEGGHISISQ